MQTTQQLTQILTDAHLQATYFDAVHAVPVYDNYASVPADADYDYDLVVTTLADLLADAEFSECLDPDDNPFAGLDPATVIVTALDPTNLDDNADFLADTLSAIRNAGLDATDVIVSDFYNPQPTYIIVADRA